MSEHNKSQSGESKAIVENENRREGTDPPDDTTNASGMNSLNKKALNVLREKGLKAFVGHVFTHPENGRSLSYAEMRDFYG